MMGRRVVCLLSLLVGGLSTPSSLRHKVVQGIFFLRLNLRLLNKSTTRKEAGTATITKKCTQGVKGQGAQRRQNSLLQRVTLVCTFLGDVSPSLLPLRSGLNPDTCSHFSQLMERGDPVFGRGFFDSSRSNGRERETLFNSKLAPFASLSLLRSNRFLHE